jgi:hypothetical protein
MLWIIVGGTLLVFFYLLFLSLCIIAGQADRRAIEFGRLHKNGSTEPEKAGALAGSAFQVSVSTCYDMVMKSSAPNR